MPHDRFERTSTRSVYATFAQRYADIAPTKAHNALYERPATMALLGDVAALTVLDAGCGPGICSEHLARHGAAVHAFDITPENRFVEPTPLPEMEAESERLHTELSLAPAFLCIRARCRLTAKARTATDSRLLSVPARRSAYRETLRYP